MSHHRCPKCDKVGDVQFINGQLRAFEASCDDRNCPQLSFSSVLDMLGGVAKNKTAPERKPEDLLIIPDFLRKFPDEETGDAQDAKRFRFLQSLPAKEAQAFFWNYSSRKQRAKAIDEAMARAAQTNKGVDE